MRYRDQPPIARTHQSKPSARLLRQSRPRSPNQRVKKEGPSPDTNTRSAVKEEAYCVPQSQVESPSSSPISPPPPSLLAICRSPHSPSELRCHRCRTHAFAARRPAVHGSAGATTWDSTTTHSGHRCKRASSSCASAEAQGRCRGRQPSKDLFDLENCKHATAVC